MLTKTLQGMKKKEQTKLLKRLASDVGGVDPTRNSPNPALISERSKQISYIRSMVDTWNPAQLNDALKQLDLPIIDSWNPQIIEEQRLRLTAYLIERTASGETVSIKAPGNLSLSILGVKADITPIQDLSHGDPSPTNICPIYGHTQEVITVSPVNITTLYNGQINSNGSYTTQSSSARLCNVNKTQMNEYFLPKGTYTIDFDKLDDTAPDLLQCTALTKDGKFNIIDNFANAWQTLPFTFTTTEDGYLYFTARKDASTNLTPSNYKAKIIRNTYTIDLNGTRYGGTLDVTEGVLTDEWVSVSYDGTENWLKASSATWDVFYVELSDSATGEVSDILSNSTNVSIYNFAQMVENAPCISIRTNITPNRLHIAIPNVSTVEDCKAYIAQHNLQVCYKKATATTVTLTPTQITALLGENNLSASTGNIEVKYKFKF